jgi:hypothetical protein
MPGNDNAIFAVSPMAECEWVREVLDEYCGYGPDAATRMPLVYAHINRCRWCSSELESLKESVLSVRPEWEALADKVANEARAAANKSGTADSVIDWLVPVWRMRRLASQRLGMGSAAESFASEISFSPAQGKLSISVSPSPPDGWHVIVEQMDVKADRLVIGLGNASEPALNTRVLRYGRPAEFFIASQDLPGPCLHVGNRRVKLPAACSR